MDKPATRFDHSVDGIFNGVKKLNLAELSLDRGRAKIFERELLTEPKNLYLKKRLQSAHQPLKDERHEEIQLCAPDDRLLEDVL